MVSQSLLEPITTPITGFAAVFASLAGLADLLVVVMANLCGLGCKVLRRWKRETMDFKVRGLVETVTV